MAKYIGTPTDNTKLGRKYGKYEPILKEVYKELCSCKNKKVPEEFCMEGYQWERFRYDAITKLVRSDIDEWIDMGICEKDIKDKLKKMLPNLINDEYRKLNL